MKTIILMLAIMFSSYTIIMAQESHWLLGGSIGFDRSVNTVLYPSPDLKSSESRVAIRPYLGKKLNAQWVVGLTSGYSFQSNDRDLAEDNRTEKTNLHAGSIGVFTRYGFNPGNKLVLHLETALLTNFSKTTLDVRDDEIYHTTSTSVAIAMDPIITYEIDSKINLIGRFKGLGYQVGSWTIKGESSRKNFSIFNGTLDLLSIQAGVEIKL